MLYVGFYQRSLGKAATMKFAVKMLLWRLWDKVPHEIVFLYFMTRNKKIGTRKIFKSSLSTSASPCSTRPKSRWQHLLFVLPARKPPWARNSVLATLSTVYYFFSFGSWFFTWIHVFLLCCLCFHCKATSHPYGPCYGSGLINTWMNESLSNACAIQSNLL